MNFETTPECAMLRTALAAGQLLVVWADVPFPPQAQLEQTRPLILARWREKALSGSVPPLWETAPVPILSLDPTSRLIEGFREHRTALTVMRSRRDLPVVGRHTLLQLAGELETRGGLLLTWADVRDVMNNPDRAYLLREAGRVAREGIVLVLAPAPEAAFVRLWEELFVPGLRGAKASFVLGPQGYPWPAPLRTLPAAPDLRAILPFLKEETMPDASRHGVSIPELRSRLQRFDDVELESLCLDHFPAVYDRFSRGLRRDEMVNLLLGYVRRRPEAGARLAALLELLPAGEAPARGDVAPVIPAPPLGSIRNRWALLVGVDTYVDPAFAPLKYCVRDVEALRGVLEEAGYTVVVLHDNVTQPHLRPNRDNVEAELARICRAAGPEDLIWVHFSCHGKLVFGRSVLITQEVREPMLARRALPLAQVEEELRGAVARRRILTLDACHTGVEVGRDLADPAFIRNAYDLAEGFALLAASTSQQLAQEWDEQEQGVFTYFLLEGLSGKADRQGKGFVTVGDLVTHTLDALRRWNVIHGGVLQEPTARTEGMGDMILVDSRAAAKP